MSESSYRPRYLVMVTGENNNKYYKQIPQGDGSWVAEYGRVGYAPQKRSYPMSQWEAKYREKIRKGYIDRTDLVEDLIQEVKPKKNNDYKAIEDEAIAKIVEKLQAMAKKAISENYTISSDAVTQAMIDKAQTIITNLTEVKSVTMFNRQLLELFTAIPRKMSEVKEHMANKKEDFVEIIKKEQDLLDVMRGQVYQKIKQDETLSESDDNNSPEQTILEANGLVFESCTEDDIKVIKRALGASADKFKNAWKVTNLKTQKRYDEFIKENKIKKTKLLFHGSRNENWWSIINTGLCLRPTNAIITGKLYGIGIYFAPKAQKSIGYTSVQGSYWARGSATSGFMALMDVAYGTPYDVYDFNSKYYSLTYESLQKFKKGANCLHAHAGASMGYSTLRNDEIVIYKEEQCTIKYLVEIRN